MGKSRTVLFIASPDEVVVRDVPDGSPRELRCATVSIGPDIEVRIGAHGATDDETIVAIADRLGIAFLDLRAAAARRMAGGDPAKLAILGGLALDRCDSPICPLGLTHRSGSVGCVDRVAPDRVSAEPVTLRERVGI